VQQSLTFLPIYEGLDGLHTTFATSSALICECVAVGIRRDLMLSLMSTPVLIWPRCWWYPAVVSRRPRCCSGLVSKCQRHNLWSLKYEMRRNFT